MVEVEAARANGPSDAELDKCPDWDARHTKVGRSEGDVQVGLRVRLWVRVRVRVRVQVWVRVLSLSAVESRGTTEGSNPNKSVRKEGWNEAPRWQVEEKKVPRVCVPPLLCPPLLLPPPGAAMLMLMPGVRSAGTSTPACQKQR